MADPSTSEAYRQLWEWMERHRAESEREVEAAVDGMPVFAAIVASIPKEAREAQRARSRELQRRALLEGDWEPMFDDLRVQARYYAQMGVEFEDWFTLLGVLRKPLLERMPDSREELGIVLGAMNEYVDRGMAVLGKTYVTEKEALIRLVLAHRTRLEADLARHVRELERSNRELDEFAFVASHDLRSPLQDIRSLAAWIADDLGAEIPEASKRHLALLDERVGRMERLLEDLLDYSRVGRVVDAPCEFRLDEAVTDVVALVAPGPGFDVHFEGEAPVLRTPRVPLDKVLRNLVGNAVKHHDRPSGRVIVTSSPDDVGRITVRVSDDGPGIPAEFQERVFRMFQTLRPRDQIEGSGMGLAFVKKTVEWFGGSVGIESAGRGATVRFTWPTQWSGSGGGA